MICSTEQLKPQLRCCIHADYIGVVYESVSERSSGYHSLGRLAVSRFCSGPLIVKPTSNPCLYIFLIPGFTLNNERMGLKKLRKRSYMSLQFGNNLGLDGIIKGLSEDKQKSKVETHSVNTVLNIVPRIMPFL